MDVKPTIVDAIGNTPLVRLRRASELTGCEIYGKAEFLNPGQSVKDRPARQMILAAEQAGTLKPGGLIVEGTAATPASGWRWSPARAGIAPSSSSRTRRARRRRTRCGWPAPH